MSSPSLIPHLHRANFSRYAKRGDREPLKILNPRSQGPSQQNLILITNLFNINGGILPYFKSLINLCMKVTTPEVSNNVTCISQKYLDAQAVQRSKVLATLYAINTCPPDVLNVCFSTLPNNRRSNVGTAARPGTHWHIGGDANRNAIFDEDSHLIGYIDGHIDSKDGKLNADRAQNIYDAQTGQIRFHYGTFSGRNVAFV